MKLMIAAGVVLLATILNVFAGEDLDPADYPDCFELVRQLGTDPKAKCVTGGDVIEVRFHSAWDNYHPAG